MSEGFIYGNHDYRTAMTKNPSSMTVQEIIDVGKEDFRDEIMVAFLGDKFSGKTVHCALIKDVLTKDLKKHTKGKYIGIGTDGSDRMNLIVDKLYAGEFPAKTLLSEATPMTLEVFSKSGGENMKIVLRDMAGEKKEDLLEKDMDVDERLEKIFKMAPIPDKPYGLLSHLVFAKIYIILVDCSKIEEWPSKQAYIKDTIRHLHDIKKRIDDLVNKRIHAPIAIVFSKYDTLKKDKKKSVKELMKQLPEVEGALEIYHKGPLNYISSSVNSIEIPEKELKEAMMKKLEEGDEDKKNAANLVADSEVQQSEAKKNLHDAKHTLNELQERLTQVKTTNDQNQINPVQEEVNKAQEEFDEADAKYAEITGKLDDARKGLDEINKSLEKAMDKLPEELGVSKYKPTKPLSYSRDGYLDLITWLIKMNKEIRGF